MMFGAAQAIRMRAGEERRLRAGAEGEAVEAGMQPVIQASATSSRPLLPSTITRRVSSMVAPTKAICSGSAPSAALCAALRAICSVTHLAPASVLPKPRPAISTQVRQAGRSGSGCWPRCAQSGQARSNASPSSSPSRFSAARRASGGRASR
jgi:hypothetical protein